MKTYYEILYDSAKINKESLAAAKDHLYDLLDNEDELSEYDRDMLKWILRHGTKRGRSGNDIDEDMTVVLDMKKLIDGGMKITKASVELKKDKYRHREPRTLENIYNC